MKKMLMLERGSSVATSDLFFPECEVEILEETSGFYKARKGGWFGWVKWLPKDGIIVKFQEINKPKESGEV